MDNIVDKLALTDDWRLNLFKEKLHTLIDQADVLDLKSYGNPIKHAGALFDKARVGAYTIM